MITEQTAKAKHKKEAAHPTEPFQLATLDQAEFPPLPSSPFRQTFHSCSSSPLLSFPLLPFALLPRKKKFGSFSSLLFSSHLPLNLAAAAASFSEGASFPSPFFSSPLSTWYQKSKPRNSGSSSAVGRESREDIGDLSIVLVSPFFLPSCRPPATADFPLGDDPLKLGRLA